MLIPFQYIHLSTELLSPFSLRVWVFTIQWLIREIQAIILIFRFWFLGQFFGLKIQPKSWPRRWTFWMNRYFEDIFSKFQAWTPPPTPIPFNHYKVVIKLSWKSWIVFFIPFFYRPKVIFIRHFRPKNSRGIYDELSVLTFLSILTPLYNIHGTCFAYNLKVKKTITYVSLSDANNAR